MVHLKAKTSSRYCSCDTKRGRPIVVRSPFMVWASSGCWEGCHFVVQTKHLSQDPRHQSALWLQAQKVIRTIYSVHIYMAGGMDVPADPLHPTDRLKISIGPYTVYTYGRWTGCPMTPPRLCLHWACHREAFTNAVVWLQCRVVLQ